MNTLAIIAAMMFGQLGIVPEKPAPLRVIVFTAEWCGPCRELHAEIERELFKPGLGWKERIEFIDVDFADSAKKYMNKDKGVPQVVIVDGDEVAIRFNGPTSGLRIAHVYNAVNATRRAK